MNEKQIIKIFFPDEQEPSFNAGDDNHVAFIADLAIRFPKNKDVIELYEQEAKVLSELKKQNIIKTKIPEMEVCKYSVVRGDKIKETVFTMHEKIEGVPYRDLSEEKKHRFFENISEDVANFLVELHSAKNTFNLQQENPTSSADYLLGRKDDKDILVDYLSKNERYSKLVKDLEETISKVNGYKDSGIHVVTHYDLHEGNILIDPEKGRLSGVIDFDTVSYRDFNEEFYAICCENPGSELGLAIKEKYEEKTNRTVDTEYLLNLKKINLYDKILETIKDRQNKNSLEISEKDQKAINGYVDKIQHIRALSNKTDGIESALIL